MSKKQEIEWWVLAEKAPNYTGWFLVQGHIIEQGQFVNTFRIVHYGHGVKKFFNNDDMQVIFWAALPNKLI